MRYLASLIVSSLAGFLLLRILTRHKPIDLLQHALLSIGIGLGISGHIGFYSLFINEAYTPVFVLSVHACLLAALILRTVWMARDRKNSSFQMQFALDRDSIIGLAALSLLMIPLWREAHFFPFGGWDAWSCWNLKARFIYLGGERWKDMLDPALWRSNNHYPFLLPLINVWGWTFYNDTNVIVPMANAVVFSLLTASLIFASLKRLTGHRWAFVPGLMLFSIPFVNKLSISQYSDIVVAFYLLAALSGLIQATRNQDAGWACIAGLCTGLLSFTKTEGLAASCILTTLAIPYFLAERKTQNIKLLGRFLTAALIAFIPAVIFRFNWAPANAAFTNGLASDGSDLLARLQAIFMFLAVELISLKWNGVWLLLLIALGLSRADSLRDGRWIIPATLGAFLACAAGFYYINTYFEIIWWLKVTLNRVLYTILPAVTWWSFLSLWSRTKK